MLGKSVSKPLRDVVRRYKHQLPVLHPFEATLADLTVRAREKSGKRTLQVYGGPRGVALAVVSAVLFVQGERVVREGHRIISDVRVDKVIFHPCALMLAAHAPCLWTGGA